ncbi:TAP42-like protein [Pleurotus eryngii]|uniref:TAP42-like protein n=1 Tax=Pleurotus eryngii TaxID=5323 RepID=A0A9P6A067_PLEER|nr:TAP42-like protein [Pleurotus eryngii]
MSVPLRSLFHRVLHSASKAHDLPTGDDATQNIVQSCLSDLKLLQSRITGLGLFSPNETIEDISTRDLVYLLVPYIYAQVIERMRTTEREDRLASLAQAQRLLRSFLESLNDYHIIPEEDRELYKQKASTIRDPSTRRELKIKQYKNEKQLKQKIEAIAIRRNQASPLKSSPSEFDLIMALLPPEVENDDEQDDEDEATSDAARDAILLLLRLAYTHANSQFESMDQELDLLRSAPPEPPTQTSDDPRRDKRKELDDMWRLDAPTVSGGPDGKGPLLDPSGKPLRPFTILPAGTSTRARLQAQVFGPDHRLPSMSIDEYLQIEQERGNIITGGGPASEIEPTSSEQLALDAEEDGTLLGEANAEKKRQKDENWAVFTDENPKGAGNTMNRG